MTLFSFAMPKTLTRSSQFHYDFSRHDCHDYGRHILHALLHDHDCHGPHQFCCGDHAPAHYDHLAEMANVPFHDHGCDRSHDHRGRCGDLPHDHRGHGPCDPHDHGPCDPCDHDHLPVSQAHVCAPRSHHDGRGRTGTRHLGRNKLMTPPPPPTTNLLGGCGSAWPGTVGAVARPPWPRPPGHPTHQHPHRAHGRGGRF